MLLECMKKLNPYPQVHIFFLNTHPPEKRKHVYICAVEFRSHIGKILFRFSEINPIFFINPVDTPVTIKNE